METPALMIKGGEAGTALVPGKSAESLVVQASLHQHDMEMPPGNNKSGAVNLTPAEIAILKQWIDQGAKASVQQERAVVLQAFAASVDPIYSVAMTKDGRYVACGRSNQIFCFMIWRRGSSWRRSVIRRKKMARRIGRWCSQFFFQSHCTKLASGSFRRRKSGSLKLANLWRLPRKPSRHLRVPT